jgi:hypothetical protein
MNERPHPDQRKFGHNYFARHAELRRQMHQFQLELQLAQTSSQRQKLYTQIDHLNDLLVNLRG